MRADPKGMAAALHEACDSIICNTDAVREVPDAIDAIRLVAVTLENVIEPGRPKAPASGELKIQKVDGEIVISTPHEHIAVNEADTSTLLDFLFDGGDGTCTLTLRHDPVPA